MRTRAFHRLTGVCEQASVAFCQSSGRWARDCRRGAVRYRADVGHEDLRGTSFPLLCAWCLALCFRRLRLRLPQSVLLRRVTLRKCLRLRLMLPFKRLRAAVRRRLLRGLRVIGCLLLLELLPLLFLAVTQVILLLLIHFVACDISCGWRRLADYRR